MHADGSTTGMNTFVKGQDAEHRLVSQAYVDGGGAIGSGMYVSNGVDT
jgi:hypothetical protein